MNVKEILPQNMQDLLNLCHCNAIPTHKHLVHKRPFNLSLTILRLHWIQFLINSLISPPQIRTPQDISQKQCQSKLLLYIEDRTYITFQIEYTFF